MICATLVNTHTHMQAAQLFTNYTISSSRWAETSSVCNAIQSRTTRRERPSERYPVQKENCFRSDSI